MHCDIPTPMTKKLQVYETPAVAAAIGKCPSRALQFYRNPSGDPAAAAELAQWVRRNEIERTENE